MAALNSSLPDEVEIIAVGDVHGCLDKLEPVLDLAGEVALLYPEKRHFLVFVGDLVDRGPDPAGVIERLCEGVPGWEIIALRGNHEAMMLDFIRSEETSWLYNGGLETMASYGVDVDRYTVERLDVAGLRRAFLQKLPEHHLNFVNRMRLAFECGDYFFVHAGVRPGIPLDRQSEEDMLWIRDAFLKSDEWFGKRIVHGHTPVKVATFRDNRINLDTGACFGGPLTAVLIRGTEVTLLL